jgi:hypothetical protein
MNDPKPARRQRMAKWQLAVITAAIAGVVALVLTFALSPRQPTYQGKSVDGWLKELCELGYHKETFDALRKMGVRAVPFEIRALARTDSIFERSYQRLFPKIPAVLQQRLPKPVDLRRMHESAAQALINNPETRKFMSAVVGLLKHNDREVRLHACLVISIHLRPEDKNLFPILAHALRNCDPDVHERIAYVLDSRGTGASGGFA